MKNLLLPLLLASAATAQAAPEIDRIHKDVMVMANTIELAFKQDESCNHCDPKIETSYLANQGVVFTVRANSWRSFHVGQESDGFSFVIPPSEPNEVRRVEIKQMVGDILDGVGVVMDEVENQIEFSLADLQDENSIIRIDSETRRGLREINRERREIEYRRREYEIELIHADEDERKEIEKQVKELEQEIAVLETRQAKLSKTYEEEKRVREAARQAKREKAKMEAEEQLAMIEGIVLRSLCDYGTTLKNIPKDEHVSVVFERKNEPEQRIVVMNIDDISSCRDAKSLKNNATSYLF
tara:strand:+ start:3189 stop:4082 length:894 start_codon:yes stop_codon:yes gene_type:complete